MFLPKSHIEAACRNIMGEATLAVGMKIGLRALLQYFHRAHTVNNLVVPQDKGHILEQQQSKGQCHDKDA